MQIGPPNWLRAQWLRNGLEEKFGPDISRRTTGIIVAVAVELILIILLFTISQSRPEPSASIVTVSTFDASSDAAAEEPAAEEEPQAESAENAPTPQPQPDQPQPVETLTPANPPPVITRPNRPAPRIIPLNRDDLAKFDITPKAQPAPAAPAKPSASYGPANTGRSSAPDSQRVGTAPNGQPMYAARWFREPRNDELAGYLSTASGPGWGMIACQTAPQYRVENCEIIGEYPSGSDIARSAKAAAWQFQVRPARINGEYQVGSWVRIRIDYTR